MTRVNGDLNLTNQNLRDQVARLKKLLGDVKEVVAESVGARDNREIEETRHKLAVCTRRRLLFIIFKYLFLFRRYSSFLNMQISIVMMS